jgi:molecular chaperone HscA
MKIPVDLKTGEIIENNKPEVIVGIDLGTTNSLVAFIQDGRPITIQNEISKNVITPSIIHFEEDGRIVVGEQAKQKSISFPKRTIFSVKRLMGKSYEDLKDFQSHLGYEIFASETSELVKIRVGSKYYSPIELSSYILKSLKEDAEKALKTTISKCVITVPAYFNDAQRQATRDAGKLAGLDVLRIVNEPTAASLAYGIGLDRNQSAKVAVYDLGGGTFDISILTIEDGIFDVLSTHGDTALGGDDIDRCIVDYWQKEYSLSTHEETQIQHLRLVAEKAKKHLTSNKYFSQEFQEHLLELTVQQLEILIKPIVDKTLVSCAQAIKDANIKIDDLDKVVLVGGSTRIPYIKMVLEQFFGQAPDASMDPDQVVALGAAIQADILAGNRKDILLLDITPLSLGIETVGGLMDVIIPRNSKVPHRAGRNYTTSVDGQKNLRISVFQGERDMVADNRKLGEFTLKDIPPMAAGIPKIEVQFLLDADGVLTVKASELRSEMNTSIEIKSTYGISEEEMALMLIDSIKNAEVDRNQRALLEAINEANNVLLSVEKFLSHNKEILSQNEVDKTILLSENLKNAVAKNQKDQIEEAMKVLDEFTTPMAHRALDHNIGQALKHKSIDL